MKPLNYPTSSPQAEYMRMRKAQNLEACMRSKAEHWFMSGYLSKTGHKFSRQATWGYRLFDFWIAKKGVAIEIDGPEHDRGYDSYRDKYNFLRSGIVVLRVPNFDDERAAWAIRCLNMECSWDARREAMGLVGSQKQMRRMADVGLINPAIYRIHDAGLFCSYGIDPREPCASSLAAEQMPLPF